MRRGLTGPLPLLGTAEPGTSVLHRATPGAKLLALVVVGTLVGLVRSLAAAPAATAVLAVLLAGCVVLARGCRLRRGLLRGQVRRTWWVLVALVVVQTWLQGPWAAATVTGGLLACLWSATLVTATTPVPELLETVVRALGPARRLGVDPERAGLAFSLTLTSVPVVGRLLAESREAAAARGLGASPRALLVPTVVRAVAHAEQVGEALAARGLD
ncbi:CbiQ family ECF transporter T component [Kineococcus sp. LSe6-4]|uniref:CbiQ family ECF transporter T component n=1 Tax=Kineococcus halophytocola TaxID=3234027 RepID=A0ABV4H5G3_9ACTN